MKPNAQELYEATKVLMEAFQYLEGRMKGGQLAPPVPMNAEALAGCILHQCMARVVREMRQRPSGQFMPLAA